MAEPVNRQKLILWLLLVAAAVAFGLGYFIFKDQLTFLSHLQIDKILKDGQELRDKILSYGLLAPLIFVGLQILQVLFAPIPGEATGALGGYLFGAWPGFLLSSVGLSLGSWIAFGASRLLSDLALARLQHTEVYHKFNHLVSKSDFTIPFILFLLPGFPKDMLSYVLGLSSIPTGVFMFIAAVGRIPGTLMLSFQGAQVYQGNFAELAMLLGVSLAIGLPCYLYRKRLLAWLVKKKSSTQNETGG